MFTRYCLVLSGAIVGLLTSLTGAQNPTRDNQTDPDRQRQVDQRHAPDANNRDAQRRTLTQTPGMLSELEGTWIVQVRVNPAVWMHKPGSDSTTERPSSQPGQSQPANEQGKAMKTCTGYATSDLVLGGNILRQVFVSQDMSERKLQDTQKQPDAQTKPDTSTLSFNPEAFRVLSYLSFDSATNKYQAVFMDSRSGKMHTHSGTYDASARRIVFENTDRNNPDDSMSSPEHDLHVDGDARVVVELLGQDRYQVTMYSSKNPVRDSRTIPNGQPASAGDMGEVVYSAMYTRATGEDLNNINNALDRDPHLSASRTSAPDAASPRSNRPDDRDRTTPRR